MNKSRKSSELVNRTLSINGVTFDLSADRSWALDVHTHGNKGLLDGINQSLASTAGPTFASLTTTGAMTAGSFVRSGGLPGQFLKADGSVDATVYLASTDSRISNWDTAHAKRPTGIAFSGTATKTLTLTLGDGSTLTANFTDLNTGSSGTVTSVGLAMPSIFSVSNSPVTTSGTLTAALVTQSANVVFAGPVSGGVATPAFRSLVAADIPTLSAYLSSSHAAAGVTTGKISSWDTAATSSHGHSNKSNLDTINQNLATSDAVTFSGVTSVGNINFMGDGNLNFLDAQGIIRNATVVSGALSMPYTKLGVGGTVNGGSAQLTIFGTTESRGTFTAIGSGTSNASNAFVIQNSNLVELFSVKDDGTFTLSRNGYKSLEQTAGGFTFAGSDASTAGSHVTFEPGTANSYTIKSTSALTLQGSLSLVTRAQYLQLIGSDGIGHGSLTLTTGADALTVLGSNSFNRIALHHNNVVTGNARLTVSPKDAAESALILRARAGQTANLAEFQLSDGTVVAGVNAQGSFFPATGGGGSDTLATVTARGATTSLDISTGLLYGAKGTSRFSFNEGAGTITASMYLLNTYTGGKAIALITGSNYGSVVFDSAGYFSISSDAKSAFSGNTLGMGTELVTVYPSGNVRLGSGADVAGYKLIATGGKTAVSDLEVNGAISLPYGGSLLANQWDEIFIYKETTQSGGLLGLQGGRPIFQGKNNGVWGSTLETVYHTGNLTAFVQNTSGLVPNPGAVFSSRFLREDGTWQVVSGGGGGGTGTVTSVDTAAANNGVSATWTNSTTAPRLTIGLGTITPTSVRLTAGITPGIEFGNISGNAKINSVDELDLILRASVIRIGMGGANWNYDDWAGLKWDNPSRTLFIGGPQAGTAYWAKNGAVLSDTTVNFVGMLANGLQVNSQAVWHAGNLSFGTGAANMSPGNHTHTGMITLAPGSPVTVSAHWYGSQAQYDAIPTKSATTKYFII
jgi:hypothetical protein